MNKEEISQLLHHRDPYLLIDNVLEDSKESITCEVRLKPDSYFFKGHFPGAPILPGAMMQEISTQAAGILITKHYSPVEDYNSNTTKGHALGVLKKVNYAKYKHMAKPGDLLKVNVELTEKVGDLFEFKCTLKNHQKTIMENSFQLVNIEDKHLY